MFCLQHVFEWSREYYENLYEVLWNHFTYCVRIIKYEGVSLYILLRLVNIN